MPLSLRVSFLTEEISPHAAAFKGRCPACGEGKLYDGYLALAGSCGHCGLDLETYDQADGPAVFVMFIVGFLVIIPMFIVEVSYSPSYWVHAALWLPWTLLLVLGFLRPVKSWLVAEQYKHKAAEGRLDDQAR